MLVPSTLFRLVQKKPKRKTEAFLGSPYLDRHLLMVQMTFDTKYAKRERILQFTSKRNGS